MDCIVKRVSVAICLLTLAAMSSCVAIEPCAPPGCSVRFDGVYKSEAIEDAWSYARFYADGTVLRVTSTGTPRDLQSWFKASEINRLDLSHGRYRLRRDHIEFSSRSSYGIVDYQGTVRATTLDLTWHSHINGNRGRGILTFIPLPESSK
jgi:hypothetical protein